MKRTFLCAVTAAVVFSVLAASGAASAAMGEKAFRICAEGTAEEIVRAVKTRAISPRDTYADGFSPLHIAAQYNADADAVSALVDLGFSVNHRSRQGMTPLMCAVLNPNPGVAERLIKANAQINRPDKYGDTALMYACRYAHDIGIVKALLDAGANVKAVNSFGQSPLMYAAYNDDAGVTALLIKHGASDDRADKDGRGALFYAAGYNRNQEVVRAIIDGAGGDPLARDAHGYTPLLFAVRNKTVWETVRELIERGSDLGAVDPEGNTALLLAVRFNPDPDVTAGLLDAGLSPYEKNDAGADAFALIMENPLLVGTYAYDYLAQIAFEDGTAFGDGGETSVAAEKQAAR